MRWNNPSAKNLPWATEIKNLEEKQLIGKKIAEKVKDGQTIGVGSGSTAFVALQEIAKTVKENGYQCLFVPTSRELQITCNVLGLITASLLDARPDWHFDGADEVDAGKNLIKGRGGALYREKLVMGAAEITYILVDQSKMVDKLCSKFPVPVELHQEALNYVEEQLFDLGAKTVQLRMAQGKDGPIITENGNLILDAHFDNPHENLEKNIKGITGVIESGLFWGYSPEIVTD